ncbi:MAG TPA: HAD family phosphatase [Pirellulales bacterium]|nr:HAD family phosphatase [Pirellulales bacterium]
MIGPDSSQNDVSPSPPTAAVFDMDGLLFNTEDLYQDVGGELLRRRGHEFGPELLHAMMGRPGRVALQMMIDYHGLNDTVETLAAESARIFPAILDQRLAFMPGVPELLAALEQSGIPKAVATSSGRPFTGDVLGRFDLEPRFRFVLTAEDVVEGKPHPEIYLKAAACFGAPPGEMVVFEDSQNGCRAAVAAGAVVVAVPGGHSRLHDFSGATLVADTLADPRIYDLLQIPPAVR